MTRKLKDDDLIFINYGYEEEPPLNLPLSAEDEANRYFINLYHVTAAQTDIRGKRVLEVGCGHGGGASYRFPRFLSEVNRVLRPGGDFLYADHRQSHRISAWEHDLANAPLQMVSHRVINAEVARGIEKNMDWARYTAERTAPRLLRPLVLRGHKVVQERLEKGSTEADVAGSSESHNGSPDGSWDHFRLYHFTSAQ
ncbi:hypothetical protein FR943_17730 [Mycobacterium sp. TNTM28]|uniref:Methyltransferase type 11 domain-containing protein n=1 Tax=[Mycobacterium] fortunisiensis TaxID=2600579 RepID=A0ABS6KPX9_9MYCO|nr:hypothetical protein [[Mycobacterium] fortunisiensis]